MSSLLVVAPIVLNAAEPTIASASAQSSLGGGGSPPMPTAACS